MKGRERGWEILIVAHVEPDCECIVGCDWEALGR